MNIRVIENKDAFTLCERPENHFFDHKSFEIKAHQLQKHAVAFANADGGEIAIGIEDEKREKDPTKRWKGPDNIEAFNQFFQALHEVTPPLTYTATFLRRMAFLGMFSCLESKRMRRFTTLRTKPFTSACRHNL